MIELAPTQIYSRLLCPLTQAEIHLLCWVSLVRMKEVQPGSVDEY